MEGRVLLEVEGVTCTYGAEPVLDGVCLRVHPGELVAVVGPNGAGKSTLLKLLARLLIPRRGAVCLDGRDVGGMEAAELAREVASVPAEGGREHLFTVEEAVLLGRLPHLRPLQREGECDREAVHRALVATALDALAGRPVSRLSGGEAQRVLLARALAQEPRVLLLDEPTAHLDLGHQGRFLELVRGLCRTRGTAVIAALHDLNLASLYADRIILLAGGCVLADGSPAEVLTPDHVARAYGADVLVQPHPLAGRPQVFLVPAAGNGNGNGKADGRGGVECAFPAS